VTAPNAGSSLRDIDLDLMDVKKSLKKLAAALDAVQKSLDRIEAGSLRSTLRRLWARITRRRDG
jgi:hypothetical protein